jgi:predicted nucleic acid-binding Zn ribbon protein
MPDMKDIHTCAVCSRPLKTTRPHVDTCSERCYLTLLATQRARAATFDGRCTRDPDYHARIRADRALFDAEALPLGSTEIEPGVEPLILGLCPGCGTTVSKAPGPALAALLNAPLKDRA